MRTFKITTWRSEEYTGTEFEVENDATEEDISRAAFEAVSEVLSYGWEEITQKPPKVGK